MEVWVGVGDDNWGENVILFHHFSGHMDHFKAIKNRKMKKNGNSLVWGYPPPPLKFGKKQNYFLFFHLTASLRVVGVRPSQLH